jgi:hypothetical protein
MFFDDQKYYILIYLNLCLFAFFVSVFDVREHCHRKTYILSPVPGTQLLRLLEFPE